MCVQPEHHVFVLPQRPAKVFNKARRGNRLGGVTPATTVVIRPLRPCIKRRRKEHQKTARFQRAAERRERGDIKTVTGIQHGMGEFAAKQGGERTRRAV